MKKYIFSAAGVKQWLDELYGSSIGVQADEQTLIFMGLCNWLETRFILSDEQMAYAEGLSVEFKNNLASEIIFAINHHVEIILDKPQLSTFPKDSVKVSSYETNKIHSDSSLIGDQSETDEKFSNCEASLIVRIQYKVLE